MPTEQWKDIPGYEGLYQASNLGRIKSLAKSYRIGKNYIRHVPDRIMTCSKLSQKGYPRVRINKSTQFIHRLVGLTWLRVIEGKDQINHKDGIKTNNRVDNLEWVSNQENRNHAVKNDLIAFDSRAAQTKLTRQEVEEIRLIYSTKNISQREIANQYNVCQQTINDITLYRSRTKFCD